MINPYRKNLHLIPMADSIERDAANNLQGWIILGEVDKYQDAMQQARHLRHAETLRTIRERRDYLNANGIFL